MTQVVLGNKLITNNSLYAVNRKKLLRELMLLQKRIYKATINHDYKHVHRLQKLLLASKSTEFIILLSLVNDYFNVDQAVGRSTNWQFQDFHHCLVTYASKPKFSTGDARQLYNIATDHIVITDLNCKIKSYLVYLCLKPEWEAKFVHSRSINSAKTNHSYKINMIIRLCLWYNQNSRTRFSKIYVLKNKIDILRNLKYVFLENKLNTISSINELLKKYLMMYHFSTVYFETEQMNNLSFHYIDSLSTYLLQLLQAIIMDSLSTEICLCMNLLANTTHKNTVISGLPKFLWHNGHFVFFSNSKSEIVLIHNCIVKFLTRISLVPDLTNIPILELNRGFNFLGFYIVCNSKYAQQQPLGDIIIQPSIKSQLVLLHTIKKILYHRDCLNRMRPNTYLSFWSAIRKVNYAVRQWKKYYMESRVTNCLVYKRLNIIVQAILHKWQNKNVQKDNKTQIVYNLCSYLEIKNLLRNCK